MNGRPAMSALGVAAAVLPTASLANADDALDYGHVLCDRVTAGQSYADVMTSVTSDFDNADDHQASYLIDQAVNELCPAQISQLRKSAAGYRPPTP